MRGRAAIEKQYTGSGGPLFLRAFAYATEGKTGYILGGFTNRAGGQPTSGSSRSRCRRAPTAAGSSSRTWTTGTGRKDRLKHRSFWLQEVAGDAPDAPAARRATRAPTWRSSAAATSGLWTALGVKRLEPARDVVVLEQDICGGGASGRNGGFVLSWWPKLSSLVAALRRDGRGAGRARLGGRDRRDRRVLRARTGSTRTSARPGWLWTATSAAQMGAWEGVVRPLREARRRDVPAAAPGGDRAALGLGVPPRGRARALARRPSSRRRSPAGCGGPRSTPGVRIYENTRVRSFDRARPVRIVHGPRHGRRGAAGDRDQRVGRGHPASSRARSSAITSDMVVTAPAPERLRALGWTGGECITDSQTMVDYYHVTRGGRVAFGKGGWGIALGGRIGADFDRNARRAQTVEADFRRYYPGLARRCRSRTTGRARSTARRTACRCSEGSAGASTSSTASAGAATASGRASSAGRSSRASRSAATTSGRGIRSSGASAGSFPPEPIRYVGAHVVRAAVAAKERAEMRGRQAGPASRSRLARLAPAGLEDKE